MTDKTAKNGIINAFTSPKVPHEDIVFASTAEVDKLKPWVDQVVEATGFKVVWVSDRSIISDFWFGGDYEARAQELSDALGIPVQCGDYVHEVARRLRDTKTHSQ